MNSFNKVLVLPDSDEDDSNNERYFVNLKGVYELDYSCIKEYVNLMPEEAFFLNYELDCLNVIQNDKIVEKHELWKLFCECDNLFIVNYVVYYYYRSKNWVVKSGIKFGGDYGTVSTLFLYFMTNKGFYCSYLQRWTFVLSF